MRRHFFHESRKLGLIAGSSRTLPTQIAAAKLRTIHSPADAVGHMQQGSTNGELVAKKQISSSKEIVKLCREPILSRYGSYVNRNGTERWIAHRLGIVMKLTSA